MFSNGHVETYIKPALFKEGKDAINTWKKSSKTRGLPYITVGDEQLYLCFGCKKVGKNHQNTLSSDHLRSCAHADKHLAILKGLLEVKDEPTESCPESISSEEVAALKKEVERLKSKLKEAEKDNDKLLETNEEQEEFISKHMGIGMYDFQEKHRDAIQEGTLKTYEELLEATLPG